MHGFFPGVFVWPAIFFFGFFRIVLFVLVIALIVRLVSGHGHRHGDYAFGQGYGHGFGHGLGHGPQDFDPRKVAAWRYASGQIDRAEFDRIMAGLDAGVPAAPQGPAAPPVA